LRDVIIPDALRRQFERGAQIGSQRVIGLTARGAVDAPVGVGLRRKPVEFRGVFGQRHIAARAHIGDDRGDIARDIGVAFAPVIDHFAKCRGKCRVG